MYALSIQFQETELPLISSDDLADIKNVQNSYIISATATIQPEHGHSL